MTLWNPKHVFSRPVPAEPSASFDPSRTGDPVGPRQTDPAIGTGEAHLGGAYVAPGTRRHPIGFAPPAEREQETRYRTEISFKRHHELPRASATPFDAGKGAQAPWQTPPAPAAPEQAPGQMPAVESEVVPFYKREISFRRKKEAHEAVTVETTTLDDPVEAVVMAEAHDEAEVAPEPAETSEAVETAEAPKASTGESAEVGAEPQVPFYKREISFRRKKAAEVEAGTTAVADTVEDDPAAAGERAPSPEWTVPVAVEPGPEVEPEAVPSVEPAEVMAAEEVPAPADLPADPAADATPDLPAADLESEGAVEHEPAPVELGPIPVAAAEEQPPVEDVTAPQEAAAQEDAVALQDETPAVAEAEPVAEPTLEEPLAAAVAVEALVAEDGPEPAASEDPAPAGRFGSRKQKTPKTPKAPKAKSARFHRSHNTKGRKVVGLKIGASQLAAAVVAETEAGHELLELARRPLAAGIVVDGEVRDEGALAAAVKSFFDDQKLPRNDVRVGLSSNRIGVRTIDIVGIDDDERFDNAVRFKAHEVLPVALDESVLDYRVLSQRTNESGEQMRRVLLVVAPRDQVEPYQRVADRAGIHLIGADLEALGLLRAFVSPPAADGPSAADTATVAVAIGHESSTLLVAGGGACEFTRVFDWGGSALEEAIASAVDVRPAEAATILRHLSLSGPGLHYGPLDDASRARALEAVRQRLTPFARELVNSLQFYQTQAESLGIGGIVITGGTSQLEGLSGALHQMIGVDVTVGDPFARVIRAGEFDPAVEAAIGSMAVPIGLAIDDGSTRGVDLLPKDVVKTRSRKSTLMAVGVPVAVAVPVAALALMYVGAHGKVVDRQSELDSVQAQIAALPKPKAPVIETGVVGDEAARATALASVLGGRLAWDAVFRDMSRVLPQNVWLTSLSLTQPAAASPVSAAATPLPGQAAAAPNAVAIEGYTYTQPDVALLLARLATLPSLQRVTLASSQTATVGPKKVVHFVIAADLNTGGAS